MTEGDDKKKRASARAAAARTDSTHPRSRDATGGAAARPRIRARRSVNPAAPTKTHDDQGANELGPSAIVLESSEADATASVTLDASIDDAMLVESPANLDARFVDAAASDDDLDDAPLPPPPDLPRISLGSEGFEDVLARAKQAIERLDASIDLGVPGGRHVGVEHASIAAPAPDDESGAVLITGICGRLGKLVVRELHRDTRVIGIDRRPFPEVPKDVVHHRFDMRRKKTRDVFRHGRVRAVVHLGVMHDPRSNHRDRHSWNVVAFQKLLEYMAQYQVRKLVVLSSANVYGPQPDNPQFLTEDAPLLGSQEFYAIRDLVELDMLAQGSFWKNTDVDTVILRPCHILGEVRNAPSNYLRLDNPVTILGFDPMIQVIHERDVVRAIRMALEPGVRGVFNLRGPGELPLSRLLAMAGKTPRSIAAPLAKIAITQLWRLRLASFPAPEIDHIRYVCMVDDSRARETLGWAPRYSLEQAISAALNAA